MWEIQKLKIKTLLFANERKIGVLGVIMGIKELSKSIGLWAMPEDTKEPKDGQAIRRASGLMGQGQKHIVTNEWCFPRSQTSSESIEEGWYLAA